MLKQKEQLKELLGAKDREEGARGSETVKVQLRSTLVSDMTPVILDFGLKIFVILCYEIFSDSNAITIAVLLMCPQGDYSGQSVIKGEFHGF